MWNRRQIGVDGFSPALGEARRPDNHWRRRRRRGWLLCEQQRKKEQGQQKGQRRENSHKRYILDSGGCRDKKTLAAAERPGRGLAKRPLKDKLQAQLQDARVVRRTGVQEVGLANAGCARVSRAVVGVGTGTEATADATRTTGNRCEVGVIEDVERLRTELQRYLFVNGEVLEQCHVEIGQVGVAQEVAVHIAEGQAAGQGKGSRVVVQIGADAAKRSIRTRIRISDEVKVRTGAGDSVAHTSIVTECSTIGYAEGGAGVIADDAGPLPSAEQGMSQA